MRNKYITLADVSIGVSVLGFVVSVLLYKKGIAVATSGRSVPVSSSI